MVTDAVCTISGSPGFLMMTADGPYGTLYEVDLKKKTHSIRKRVKAQDSYEETGKNTLVCQWGMFFYVNRLEFKFKRLGMQEGLDGV